MARTISPTIWGWISWATAGSVIFAGTWWVLAQDNSSIFFDDTNSRLGLMTTAPTHTLTLWSTGTGIAIYNTADQTTNFENWWITRQGNVMFVWTWKWWSGATRPVSLSSSAWLFNNSTANNTRLTVTQGTGVNFNFNSSSTWNITEYIKTPSTFTASSVVTSILSLSPTINMTSTGWFCLLDLNPVLSATWSWAKNAILYRNAGWSTLFGVDYLWAFTCSNTVGAWVAVASTHKVTIDIWWTTYYLLASNV